MAGAEERGAIEQRAQDGQATSVEDMRRELEASRHRMSQDMDVIEQRLRRVADNLRERMDLLQPVRARIREDVWGSLAVAFGIGLGFAVLTAKREDGRRSFAGEVLRSAVGQLPAAVISGMRAGVGDALREEWRRRPARLQHAGQPA